LTDKDDDDDDDDDNNNPLSVISTEALGNFEKDL